MRAQHFFGLGLALITPSAAAPAAPSAAERALKCCQDLSGLLPGKLTWPNADAYKQSLASYWAESERSIFPACIVVAAGASDVSTAVKVVASNSCPFAFRSGGHGAAPSVANVQGGVTIDMSRLDSITPKSGSALVDIGPGAEWGEVYGALAPLGVTVSGGTAAGVGVGGSTLGTGIGYTAAAGGFAADNVVEYEVVLATGQVVKASKSSNPDLFNALKGGGANLGVVTKFTFQTLPLSGVWGGDAVWASDSLDGVAQAFSSFLADPEYDDKAQVLMSFAHTADFGDTIVANLFYAAPVTNPPVYDGFASVPGQLLNDTAVTSLQTLSNTMQARSPDGQQHVNFSFTIKNNVQMIKDVWTIFEATFPQVSPLSVASWALTLAAIPHEIALKSQARGGNSLGLNIPAEGVILIHLSVAFTAATDYSKVAAISDKLLADLIAQAKKIGAFHPFIDLNHAGGAQKVFQGYGPASHNFLKTTAKKYDSKGIFQTLASGPFKL
jgi:FAD/FMN-containing dehydrogenase